MDRRTFQILVIFSLLLGGSGAWGAEASSPKAAARNLHLAIERGDAAAVERALYAGKEAALGRSLARLMVTGRRFQVAARKQFGATAETLAADMTAGDELQRIDEATVSLKGDRAEMHLKGAGRPIVFVKIEGAWRLDAADYAGARPDRAKAQAALLERVAGVVESITRRMEKGEWDSPQGVRRAMEKEMAAAMAEGREE